MPAARRARTRTHARTHKHHKPDDLAMYVRSLIRQAKASVWQKEGQTAVYLMHMLHGTYLGALMHVMYSKHNCNDSYRD